MSSPSRPDDNTADDPDNQITSDEKDETDDSCKGRSSGTRADSLGELLFDAVGQSDGAKLKTCLKAASKDNTLEDSRRRMSETIPGHRREPDPSIDPEELEDEENLRGRSLRRRVAFSRTFSQTTIANIDAIVARRLQRELPKPKPFRSKIPRRQSQAKPLGELSSQLGLAARPSKIPKPTKKPVSNPTIKAPTWSISLFSGSKIPRPCHDNPPSERSKKPIDSSDSSPQQSKTPEKKPLPSNNASSISQTENAGEADSQSSEQPSATDESPEPESTGVRFALMIRAILCHMNGTKGNRAHREIIQDGWSPAINICWLMDSNRARIYGQVSKHIKSQ